MPRKYPEIEFKKKIRLIKKAGLTSKISDTDENYNNINSLNRRIKKILNITQNYKKNKTKMLFFVMYDIEDDKVRREIAKYLQDKGCVRVQKSIFFASTERKIYSEINKTIKDVNEFYQNNDSIFLVPVSTDQIRSMKIIGQNVDFDIIMGNRNTLFF